LFVFCCCFLCVFFLVPFSNVELGCEAGSTFS
jgi:hypothetical protein